jgi:threonine/homoserine/homoserine lactone efflux protein
MMEPAAYLISGIVFGTAAGISPGPLLTLVIAETVKHSRKEGIKVASAPIITDLPIVLASIFVIAKLSHSDLLLGIISILGAMFIGYLAYESITVEGIELDLKKVKPKSLRKGVITNFLNPHPYLFWIAVGAPITLKAFAVSFISAFSFILGFYICLIGSKVLIALVVDRSKDFLKSNAYVYIIRFLGVILLIFSGLFIRDGLKFFGFIG